jgi:hypothetical protein
MVTFTNDDTTSSAYKRYKADTEYVAGWLAQESSVCGYRLRTPPRLKGKARKLVGLHIKQV